MRTKQSLIDQKIWVLPLYLLPQGSLSNQCHRKRYPDGSVHSWKRLVLIPAALGPIQLEVQPRLLPKVLVSPFQILCRQQTGRENLPLRSFTVVPHSQIVWERLYLEHIKRRYIVSFYKPYTVICTPLPWRGIDNLARNVCSEMRLEFYERQSKHITVYFPSQEICPSWYIWLLLSIFTDSKYRERKFTYHTKRMSVLKN